MCWPEFLLSFCTSVEKHHTDRGEEGGGKQRWVKKDLCVQALGLQPGSGSRDVSDLVNQGGTLLKV